MNTAARGFERDFVAALFAGTAPAGLAGQPGFAVYRNTVHKSCIDTLEANFPAVVRLVGRDWFRAAAARHVRAHPPRDPCLLRYGEGFDDTLARLAPGDLPYLPGVAALDRLWSAAHIAADAPVLPPDALSGRPPRTLPALCLCPHPAARWRWFEGLPIHSIWSANRSGDAVALAALAALDARAWAGEGTLLVRPGAQVRWQPLDAAGCALLDACARGDALGDAAAAVLHAHAGVDLAALLARLLRAGAFTSLHRSPLP